MGSRVENSSLQFWYFTVFWYLSNDRLGQWWGVLVWLVCNSCFVFWLSTVNFDLKTCGSRKTLFATFFINNHDNKTLIQTLLSCIENLLSLVLTQKSQFPPLSWELQHPPMIFRPFDHIGPKTVWPSWEYFLKDDRRSPSWMQQDQWAWCRWVWDMEKSWELWCL